MPTLIGRGRERHFKCATGDIFAVPAGADPKRCPTCGSTAKLTPLQRIAVRD